MLTGGIIVDRVPKDGTPSDLSGLLDKYSLTEKQLFQIKKHLVRIAHDAGKMMLETQPLLGGSDTKKNSADRVTESDKAIEKMVKDSLEKRYPDILFVGEESFRHGDRLTDAPTFVCDPIDGTLNFIHGFPNFAISLALTIGKMPVVGVVYNPLREDLFTAIKNQGAEFKPMGKKSMRLPVQAEGPLAALSDCLVAIEWGSQREGPNWDLRTSTAMQLLTSKSDGGAMAHSVRSNGSSALDFCYVAAGYFDCFWEGGAWIWDICAGWLILEEAGGMVAGANPGDWSPTLEGRSYFAIRQAERTKQEGLVKELWGLVGDRKFDFAA